MGLESKLMGKRGGGGGSWCRINSLPKLLCL